MSLLVVEDDLLFMEIIRANLEPRTVREAHTMAEAMALIDQAVPDVVILDLSLPDSTPAQTIERIKEIKMRSKDVTVIVITGHYDIGRLSGDATKSGAALTLSKDHGFFDALNEALLNTAGNKRHCASEPTVERIEREVGQIVRSQT